MFDSLESRTLLSAVLNDGLLTVTGTDDDDQLRLVLGTLIDTGPAIGTFLDATTLARYAVTINKNTFHFNSADVDRITILALSGNDRIKAQTGPGTDAAAWAPLLIKAGAGNDTVRGGAASDVIRGGRGRDLLYGGAGNDLIDGGIDDDQLFGKTGDDTLDGAHGHDLFSGGAGRDAADYADRADDLTVSLDGKPNDGGYTSPICKPGELCFAIVFDEKDNVLPNVENVFGGSGDDRLIGNDGHNILKGNAGDDTLRGRAGNDILVAGTGADLALGGAGHDNVFISDDDPDTAFGGGGMDGLLEDNADTSTGFERPTGLVEKCILD